MPGLGRLFSPRGGMASQPPASSQWEDEATVNVAVDLSLARPGPEHLTPAATAMPAMTTAAAPPRLGEGCSEIPLDAFGSVQAALSAAPWLLALPELAAFRARIIDAAARCESGEVDEAMRRAQSEIRASLSLSDMPPASGPPAAALAAEHVMAALRERATAALLSDRPSAASAAGGASLPAAMVPPHGDDPPSPPVGGRVRSYTHYTSLTSGPCILLRGVRLCGDAVRAKKDGARRAHAAHARSLHARLRVPASRVPASRVPASPRVRPELASVDCWADCADGCGGGAGVYVLMWMVDSHDRCVGGVTSWPIKEGTTQPLWNSARQLSAAAGPSMAVHLEVWHATKEVLIGVAQIPTTAIASPLPLTLPLRKPDEIGAAAAASADAPHLAAASAVDGDDGAAADAGAAAAAASAVASAPATSDARGRQSTITIQQAPPASRTKRVRRRRAPRPEASVGAAKRARAAKRAAAMHRVPRAPTPASLGPHGPQVFFVRHGESRWNEAQRRKDVLQMVSHVDHPLNETGYRQALHLQHAIRNAMSKPVNELSSSPTEAAALHALTTATTVWASPLTRALQTALIGLRPMLEVSRRPIASRSARTSAGSRTTPARGTAPPACGIAPPACGIAPPACGIAPPACGIAPPVHPHARDGALPLSPQTPHGRSLAAHTSAPFRCAHKRALSPRTQARPLGGAAQARPEMGIELKPNAREKKNFGGRDTIGQAVGAECRERAIVQLASLADSAELDALRSIPLRTAEVETPWWVTAAERTDSVRACLARRG